MTFDETLKDKVKRLPGAVSSPELASRPPGVASPRRVAWIGGWGVDPVALRPLAEHFFAGAEHVFFAPTEDAARSATRCGQVVAWSFGARRVLDAAAGGIVFPGRVWLLAPFLEFCAEHGPGSLCRLAQVRWLKRWLTRDPRAALHDFYTRAGLGAFPLTGFPYAVEDLLEGLDRLAEPAPEPTRELAGRGLPAGWIGVVGTADPLLDAAAICAALPGCRAVGGLGHEPVGLLAAAKEMTDAI